MESKKMPASRKLLVAALAAVTAMCMSPVVAMAEGDAEADGAQAVTDLFVIGADDNGDGKIVADEAYGMVMNYVDAESCSVHVVGDNEYDAAEATADGTITVQFTATSSRNYDKVALATSESTDEELDAIAQAVETTKNDDGEYVSKFTISVPVTAVDQAVPIMFSKSKGDDPAWSREGKGDEAYVEKYIYVNPTPALVDEFVNNVAVQGANESTDLMCQAAGLAYANLTDEEKADFDENAENAGWFDTADPVGKTSADEVATVCSAPTKTKEILVVSFGTSFNTSRLATIGKIEEALQAAYPDYDVRRAFTSQIIMNHINARDGVDIDNVAEAMDKAVAAGVTELIVQPTTLMNGAEYKEMRAAVAPYEGKIDTIIFADPLLHALSDPADPASTDVQETNAAQERALKAVVAAALADTDNNFGTYATAADAAKAGVALVFMGHGTADEAATTYAAMQDMATALGYDNVFVGTVEGRSYVDADGNPMTELDPMVDRSSIINVFKAVKNAGYTKVILRPLMIVSGDHANNDMAGEGEDSWWYAFVNGEIENEELGQEGVIELGEGFGLDNVKSQVAGMGEIADIQQMIVDNAGKAMGQWTRLGGDTRFLTAQMLTAQGFAPASADKIIVATGAVFADALTASSLSGAWAAPVVITMPDWGMDAASDAAVLDTIKRVSNGSAEVYIIGGESAVSKNVENAIAAEKDYVKSVTRIAGDTRIETATLTYQACKDWGDTAIVTNAWNFPDALAVGSYAAVNKAPIFGTTNGELSADQAAIIKGNFKNVVVLGGDAAVNYDSVKAALGSGVTTIRFAGDNRFETAQMIALWASGNDKAQAVQPATTLSLDDMAIATAVNFPDALTAVNLLGQEGTALLLVDNSNADNAKFSTTAVDTVVKANADKINHGYAIGGEAVVNTAMLEQLQDAAK